MKALILITLMTNNGMFHVEHGSVDIDTCLHNQKYITQTVTETLQNNGQTVKGLRYECRKIS